MNLNDYKASIKIIIGSTNNGALLKHWKKQLEWDVPPEEIELSNEEWKLIEEGMADYESGAVYRLKNLYRKG
jgi:hypothetical protein